MKREIIFRGKRIDNGEWVEGSFNINTWSFDSTHWFLVIGNIHLNPELLNETK